MLRPLAPSASLSKEGLRFTSVQLSFLVVSMLDSTFLKPHSQGVALTLPLSLEEHHIGDHALLSAFVLLMHQSVMESVRELVAHATRSVVVHVYVDLKQEFDPHHYAKFLICYVNPHNEIGTLAAQVYVLASGQDRGLISIFCRFVV